MQHTLVVIGMLAGGLGLFLLAVAHITDGLKTAVGPSLRHILSRWTRTPFRGVMTGLSITALIQSSSAVTVATIGFVNGGLMSLYQALGIIFGANIGTTMTAWLVALLGFKIKVEAFALPLIGLGMVFRLTGGDSRRGAIGLAMAGFGLFFIGIDVLRDAFEGLVAAIDLEKLTVDGPAAVAIFLVVGFLMTLLTQSSSAAIAITLTAANSNLLGIYAAAAMVIGANVGTTSTAALAVIGATANAKRVASAHIIFNVLTAVVALLLLPLMFATIYLMEGWLGLEAIPAVSLALFHTLFNVLGVLLMLPMSQRLARFLEKRFVSQEEMESRLRYLDKTVAASPVLAVNAILLEMIRVTALVRRLNLAVVNAEFNHNIQTSLDRNIIHNLAAKISDFIQQLERKNLSGDTSAQLAKLLRAEQHLLASTDLAVAIAEAHHNQLPGTDLEGSEEYLHFRAEIVKLVELSDLEANAFSPGMADSSLTILDEAYHAVKATILTDGAASSTAIHTVIEAVDQASRIRRMARQLLKSTYLLHEVSLSSATSDERKEKEETKEITDD